MAATKLVALLLQALILLSVQELDEDTWEHMQQREKEMDQEMAQLLEKMERRSQLPMFLQQRLQEQTIMDYQPVLFADIVVSLVLLFRLCWWITKSRLDMSTDVEKEEAGIDIDGLEDKKSIEMVISRGQVVKKLVDHFVQLLQERLSNTSFPVLQLPIGVGSAFEGWCPHEKDDAVYQLLVPLKAPAGYTFCLELGMLGQTPGHGPRIRVELECTCGTQKMRCFACNTKKQLGWRKRAPSLRTALCSNSYLDAAKVARWFQGLVKEAWVAMPQADQYKVKVLPSFSSCHLQLTSDSGTVLNLEMIFGVQQGDTDIFLSSQTAEDTYTPSTVWTENYAVAERKFFSHIATQVPGGTIHLRCLKLWSHILESTDISPYILKTVVMHLLNTIPVSDWCRERLFVRMVDVLRFLGCCLKAKKLSHFFFGNTNMPKEIILPSVLESSRPRNLFHHLVQNPSARIKAVKQLQELQYELFMGLHYSYVERWSQ
ncbi:inositol 1,4,5-trisphosphate receptor-interacting protein-like 1 [Pogoniulus pusillus]|uniref:inositol 1,4,5-trisphosphate receptor-interacting protein-like 1 n=1 Tax=Pogoniulus pusillus TaxID=488313 RepID=UPI0030B9A81A